MKCAPLSTLLALVLLLNSTVQGSLYVKRHQNSKRCDNVRTSLLGDNLRKSEDVGDFGLRNFKSKTLGKLVAAYASFVPKEGSKAVAKNMKSLATRIYAQGKFSSEEQDTFYYMADCIKLFSDYIMGVDKREMRCPQKCKLCKEISSALYDESVQNSTAHEMAQHAQDAIRVAAF